MMSVVLSFALSAIVIAIFLVAGVVLILLVWQYDQARKSGLRKWALANDWRYVRRPAIDWSGRVRDGFTGPVAFALYGVVAGRPVAIAECFLSKQNSAKQEPEPFVLLMAGLREPVPAVAVHRRLDWERTERRLALDRPTFVGDDVFDQEYRVVAPDSAAARAVVGPALIAAHVAGKLPDWSVRGTEVLTYRAGDVGMFTSIPNQFTSVMLIADLIEADVAAGPPRGTEVTGP
jgi:hypothetical protein